jgi:hypothetical protein
MYWLKERGLLGFFSYLNKFDNKLFFVSFQNIDCGLGLMAQICIKNTHAFLN